MAVTQKVTLYNNKFTVPPVINAVQNDTDRQVEAYFGDFTLQVGMIGKLSFIRSDGTHYEVSATLSTANNTATAELDQALTQAGVTQAQLKITDSGNVGSTFTFMIKVQPDVAGISVPQDGWSAQEFDQRLTDVENAIDAVEEDVADLQDKEYDYAPVITDTASGAIASFPDGADNYPMRSVVAEINPLQAGTGDPSPTNVRPISGWSNVKIMRTGKNSIDVTQSTANTRTNNGVAMVSTGYSLSDYFPVKPNTTYYIKNALLTSTGEAIAYYDSSKNYVGRNYLSVGSGTVTTHASAYYARVSYPTANANSVACNYPSTETGYIPFEGSQTFTIDLGDTRYGAELDVTRGKLKVTHAYKVLNGTETWYAITSPANGFRNSGSTDFPGRKSGGEFICNRLYDKGNSLSDLTNTWDAVFASNLNIRTDNLFADADEFKAWVASNNLECVYELETPVEVDLTPTEITTLLGTNNLWSDTGDIDLTYCADTKRYIQKLISQLA